MYDSDWSHLWICSDGNVFFMIIMNVHVLIIKKCIPGVDRFEDLDDWSCPFQHCLTMQKVIDGLICLCAIHAKCCENAFEMNVWEIRHFCLTSRAVEVFLSFVGQRKYRNNWVSVKRPQEVPRYRCCGNTSKKRSFKELNQVRNFLSEWNVFAPK